MADEPPASAKPRGRPRVPEPGTNVSSWVRQADYDKLCELARKYDVSVSTVVRRLLTRTLR